MIYIKFEHYSLHVLYDKLKSYSLKQYNHEDLKMIAI